VAVAVVLIGGVGAGLIWWHWGLVGFLAGGLVLGVWELDRAWRTAMKAKTARWPVLAGALVVIPGAYAAALGDLPWSAPTVIIGVLSASAVLCLIWRLPGGSAGYVRDAAASLFELVYPVLLASTLVLMLADDRGAGRIALFILCVVASDTGGYFAGIFLGKHPMAPRISPKKSWEGLVGSFILAAPVGIVTGWLVLDTPWWRALIIAWIITLVGVLGDLIESAMKRDFGVKDLGTLLPGHGGVMDRIDSYIAAAPAAWLAMIALVPHV
jgi:phosphatidate cytidylyltransferase